MDNVYQHARVPEILDAAARFGIIAPVVFERAASVDVAAAFPTNDIEALAEHGLLIAALPRIAGGEGLATDFNAVGNLAALLAGIGDASLTVGRLFEGHCNSILLVERFGGPMATLAAEAVAGRVSGVWNAERGAGLSVRRASGGWCLDGRKVHCSGAGSIARPLVTAHPVGVGAPLMMLIDMDSAGIRIDLSVWQAAGMRGTATGTVDFDDVFVADSDVVGVPGDYDRAPLFSGGAWRVLAVQLGGMRRVLSLHADQLAQSGRGGDAVARHRFAAAAGAFEAARLIVAEAARRATDPNSAPEAAVAYVDLARGSFETLALASVDLARRNTGLSAFNGPHPLDRCCRDLETYLRQPMVDASRDSAANYLLSRGGTFE
jgi:alkylation response protein AidB-like acyl-CoA dehydrogenase